MIRLRGWGEETRTGGGRNRFPAASTNPFLTCDTHSGNVFLLVGCLQEYLVDIDNSGLYQFCCFKYNTLYIIMLFVVFGRMYVRKKKNRKLQTETVHIFMRKFEIYVIYAGTYFCCQLLDNTIVAELMKISIRNYQYMFVVQRVRTS